MPQMLATTPPPDVAVGENPYPSRRFHVAVSPPATVMFPTVGVLNPVLSDTIPRMIVLPAGTGVESVQLIEVPEVLDSVGPWNAT